MEMRGNVLIALFEDRLAAERAVDELEQQGFSGDEIGFAIRGADAVRGGMITDAVGTKDGTGAVKGAVTGGAVGALLAAAATLAIPGVGPVVAGGVLSTIFGFAAAGAATGGILGALAGLGLSEEEAQFYEHEFQSGRALVMVRSGTRAAEAGEILRRHGGYNLHNRTVAPAPPSERPFV